MELRTASSSRAAKWVLIGRRNGGGVVIKLISRTPDRLMYKVRGMGVAESVKTSTSLRKALIFSF